GLEAGKVHVAFWLTPGRKDGMPQGVDRRLRPVRRPARSALCAVLGVVHVMARQGWDRCRDWPAVAGASQVVRRDAPDQRRERALRPPRDRRGPAPGGGVVVRLAAGGLPPVPAPPRWAAP